MSKSKRLLVGWGCLESGRCRITAYNKKGKRVGIDPRPSRANNRRRRQEREKKDG